MVYLRRTMPTENIRKPAAMATAALRRRKVASVKCLADDLGWAPAEVRAALEAWVARGQVELLRPWRRPAHPDDELDYYRWRQPTDRDHLWEQDYMLGCVCGAVARWRLNSRKWAGTY